MVVLVLASSLWLTALIGALSWFRSQRCLRGRYRSSVIVTLKSGLAFRGVLFDADAGTVVLRKAEAMDGQNAPLPVDGEVLLLRSEIEFVQRP